MPSKELHIFKAEHNKKFLDSVINGNEEYNDWSATVIFYCAVHLVEAYFAEKGEHHTKHVDRKKAMKCESELASVMVSYKAIESLSKAARYDCVVITKEKITSSKAKLLYLEKCLPK